MHWTLLEGSCTNPEQYYSVETCCKYDAAYSWRQTCNALVRNLANRPPLLAGM